jgi:hypothetical protein
MIFFVHELHEFFCPRITRIFTNFFVHEWHIIFFHCCPLKGKKRLEGGYDGLLLPTRQKNAGLTLIFPPLQATTLLAFTQNHAARSISCKKKILFFATKTTFGYV